MLPPIRQHCSFIKMQGFSLWIEAAVGHAVTTLPILNALYPRSWYQWNELFSETLDWHCHILIFLGRATTTLSTLALIVLRPVFRGISVLSDLTSRSFRGAECSHNTHSHLLSNLPQNRCLDLKWQSCRGLLQKDIKTGILSSKRRKKKCVIIFTKKNVVISDKLLFFLFSCAQLSTIW